MTVGNIVGNSTVSAISVNDRPPDERYQLTCLSRARQSNGHRAMTRRLPFWKTYWSWSKYRRSGVTLRTINAAGMGRALALKKYPGVSA
jgi:hypothetical protein